MAQRLEAALAGAGDASETRDRAPPVAPEPRRSAPRATAPRATDGAPVATPSPKSGFENLEDEMASLLPSNRTIREVGEVPRRVLFLATLIAAGSLANPAFAQDISINLARAMALTSARSR